MDIMIAETYIVELSHSSNTKAVRALFFWCNFPLSHLESNAVQTIWHYAASITKITSTRQGDDVVMFLLMLQKGEHRVHLTFLFMS